MVRSLNNLYYIELGKLRERERIIELLKDDLAKTRQLVVDGYYAYEEKIDYIENLVALIKGVTGERV